MDLTKLSNNYFQVASLVYHWCRWVTRWIFEVVPSNVSCIGRNLHNKYSIPIFNSVVWYYGVGCKWPICWSPASQPHVWPRSISAATSLGNCLIKFIWWFHSVISHIFPTVIIPVIQHTSPASRSGGGLCRRGEDDDDQPNKAGPSGVEGEHSLLSFWQLEFHFHFNVV